eukprot:1050875_1
MAACNTLTILLMLHVIHTSNSQYLFVEQKVNWAAAASYCQTTYGTSLASIHNETDNEQVSTLCQSSCPSCSANWQHGCWIGLNDKANERHDSPLGWVWLDGSAFDFEKWRENEPTGGTDRDCVFIYPADYPNAGGSYQTKWADVECSATAYFLCNDPDPPTAQPTDAPTQPPTTNPSHSPTDTPSNDPTINPSHTPTTNPSRTPSIDRSTSTTPPTATPSLTPTTTPPSVQPTAAPSFTPTAGPTATFTTEAMTNTSETTATFATEAITTTTVPRTTTAFPMTITWIPLATLSSLSTSEAIVPRIHVGITDDNGATIIILAIGSLPGCVVLCIIVFICLLRKNRTLVSVQTNNFNIPPAVIRNQSPSDDDMISGENDTGLMDDIRIVNEVAVTAGNVHAVPVKEGDSYSDDDMINGTGVMADIRIVNHVAVTAGNVVPVKEGDSENSLDKGIDMQDIRQHVETVVTALSHKEIEEQCEDCGKRSALLLELDEHLYCRDCKTCYDDDADDLYKPQPVTKTDGESFHSCTSGYTSN